MTLYCLTYTNKGKKNKGQTEPKQINVLHLTFKLKMSLNDIKMKGNI